MQNAYTISGWEDEEKSWRAEKREALGDPVSENGRLSGKFELPPHGIAPKEFCETHLSGGNGAPMAMQMYKGTTTLAFIYEPKTDEDKGGIIVAADSRATGGAYIMTRDIMKILDISDTMVATMAGGAADCQFWIRMVAKYCSQYELREKMSITVSAASKYFANVLYNYRGQGLMIGSMICGIDKFGPSIFMVDNDGSRTQLKVCSVGSGSLNAYSILDSMYKTKMTDKEAVELGRRAIMHATFSDIGSGGVVNMVHLTKEGKTRYPAIDVSEMVYKNAEDTGKDLIYDPKYDD